MLLRCGEAPVPAAVSSLPAPGLSDVPTRDELADHLPRTGMPDRIVVAGGDAALAAVLTHLLRSARLDVEVAYVPPGRTAATRNLGLRTGDAAARAALAGTARPIPLIRDDLGVAVVGRAVLTGPEDGPITGETYADEVRLFSGEARGIEIRPTGEAPGLRAARIGRGVLPRRWVRARAAQTGGPAIFVRRDGVPAGKRLKRSSFYRNADDWLLVR